MKVWYFFGSMYLSGVTEVQDPLGSDRGMEHRACRFMHAGFVRIETRWTEIGFVFLDYWFESAVIQAVNPGDKHCYYDTTSHPIIIKARPPNIQHMFPKVGARKTNGSKVLESKQKPQREVTRLARTEFYAGPQAVHGAHILNLLA